MESPTKTHKTSKKAKLAAKLRQNLAKRKSWSQQLELTNQEQADQVLTRERPIGKSSLL